MVRISHSAKEKYIECGEKWRLHYQEKLRSPILNSPLWGGGAFDDAASAMLLRLKKDLTEEEKALTAQDPRRVLVNSMTYTNHNGEKVFIPTYRFTKYSKADFDVSLLESEDFKLINDMEICNEYEDFNRETAQGFVEFCRNEIKTKYKLDANDQMVFNLINWYAFKNKLLYLLDRYEEDVMPKIQEVFSVQRKVELESGEHTLIGYIDFEATWKDEPDKVYTCDNKLSSKAYYQSNIDEAEQLATYCEFTGNDNGCYVNTEKVLRKREPKHRIQIIRGDITEELYEKTFDNFGEVVHNIEEGIFEKNMEGGCFSYGQRCIYYNTCRGEPEKDFLVDLKKDKE